MVLPPSPTHLIHMLILPPWKSLGWRPHVHFSFTGAMPHLWSHTELECPTAFLRDHYMSMRSVVDNLLCNTGWSMRTERAERDSQVTNLFSQEKHSVGVEVQSVSNGKNTHWDSIAPSTPYPHSQATSLGMRLLPIYEIHFWTWHLQIEGVHHYKQGCDRGKQIFSNTIFSREPLLCISPPVTSVAVRYLSISVVETVIESLNRIISQIKLFTISVSVDTVLFSDPPDVQKYQICSHPESASESLNLLGQEVFKISNIRKRKWFYLQGWECI